MQLLFNLLEAFRTFRDRHSSPQCVTFALWYLPMQDVWNCAWFYFLQKKVCAVVFPFQFLFNFYLKKVFDCNRLFFVGTNWIIDTFWWYCTLFWNTCASFTWIKQLHCTKHNKILNLTSLSLVRHYIDVFICTNSCSTLAYLMNIWNTHMVKVFACKKPFIIHFLNWL